MCTYSPTPLVRKTFRVDLDGPTPRIRFTNPYETEDPYSVTTPLSEVCEAWKKEQRWRQNEMTRCYYKNFQ